MTNAKIMVISNKADSLKWQVQLSQSHGYITFVESNLDPDQKLGLDPFLYVRTDAEVKEKIALINSDFSIKDEVQLLC